MMNADEKQRRRNCIDLFSGIGGNALALESCCNTVLFCENNRACYPTLKAHFPTIPIHDDVRTLAASIEKYDLPFIDMVCGGFPCQDISIGGAGKGIATETRSGLFFCILDIIQKVRCPYVFLENVPAIRCRGLDIVLKSLTELHYTCHWGILSAHDVGAPHLRERWFLLARRNVVTEQVLSSFVPMGFEWSRAMDQRSDVPENEPPIIAMLSANTHLHSMLGNAVVPKQAAFALSTLLSLPASDSSLGTRLDAVENYPCFGSVVFDAFGVPFLCKASPCVTPSFYRCSPDLLYPTPTNIQRACEGTVRRARALLLAGHLTYGEACVLAGKCPFLQQGAIAELHEEKYLHVIPSIIKVKNPKSCYKERNVRWVEWVMGFPENWVRE